MSRNPPMPPPNLPLEKIGERVFDSMPKVSAEFFAISYGALVRQVLVASDDNIEAVNHQLDTIGSRIGMRLIEEFIARSQAPPCRTFQTTGETIAKVGLRMFLGISAQVSVPTSSGSASESYSLTFSENPLNFFVELPHSMRATLWYSNILCGVIRGALEQVGMHVDVRFLRDVLRGDSTNEILVSLKSVAKETFKTQ